MNPIMVVNLSTRHDDGTMTSEVWEVDAATSDAIRSMMAGEPITGFAPDLDALKAASGDTLLVFDPFDEFDPPESAP